MKVLQYVAERRVEVVDVPDPKPDAGDLVVDVIACGICATDVKTYMQGHPKIPPGSVLGHEVVGAVSAAGPGSEYRIGDVVAIAPYAPCGSCSACRRGDQTLCSQLWLRAPEPGGFAEAMRVPAEAVADTVVAWSYSSPAMWATLAEPVACGLHALEHAGVRSGSSVLVIGDGPMGLIEAAVARVLGAKTVIVAGLMPERLAVAETLADRAVDVGNENLEEAVRTLADEGIDIVSVSVPVPQAVEQAQRVVRSGGVIELFAGMPSGTRLAVDAGRIHYDGVRLQGCSGFSPADFKRAVGLLGAGAIPADRLITDTTSIDGLPEALERSAKHLGIKTLMITAPGSK